MHYQLVHHILRPIICLPVRRTAKKLLEDPIKTTNVSCPDLVVKKRCHKTILVQLIDLLCHQTQGLCKEGIVGIDIPTKVRWVIRIDGYAHPLLQEHLQLLHKHSIIHLELHSMYTHNCQDLLVHGSAQICRDAANHYGICGK